MVVVELLLVVVVVVELVVVVVVELLYSRRILHLRNEKRNSKTKKPTGFTGEIYQIIYQIIMAILPYGITIDGPALPSTLIQAAPRCDFE